MARVALSASPDLPCRYKSELPTGYHLSLWAVESSACYPTPPDDFPHSRRSYPHLIFVPPPRALGASKFLPGPCKANVFRRGIVGMRGSMALRTTTMQYMNTPPSPSMLDFVQRVCVRN